MGFQEGGLQLPPAIRTSTRSLWPTIAAFIRGVMPSSPMASTSAPVGAHTRSKYHLVIAKTDARSQACQVTLQLT